MPQDRKLTDEDVQLILRSALSGDRQAAVKLLQSFTDEMYYSARLYLKDHEIAKKAVQNAFNTAYVRLHSSASEPSFERWLHDIVRECAVKLVSPFTEEVETGVYTDADETASLNLELPDEPTCRKYLLQGLSVLTDAERLAVVMRFCDHLTNVRIAELMNISKGQVEALLTNAKAQFSAMGILLGRILALIDVIEGEAQEEERPASEAVVFPDEPEEDSFHKFENLSQEETPESAHKAEEKEDPEKTAETLVLPRMPQAATQPIQKIEVPEAEDDDDDDDEGSPSRVSTIVIILAILVILFAGVFFLYQTKPEMFSWIPFLSTEEKVEENNGEVVPGGEIATEQTPEQQEQQAVPAPEQPVEGQAEAPVPEQPGETQIGTLSVTAQLLNKRVSPSMDAEIAGTLTSGEQCTVYEQTNDGTSNWYRVGVNEWVTDGGGSYVAYTPLQ